MRTECNCWTHFICVNNSFPKQPFLLSRLWLHFLCSFNQILISLHNSHLLPLPASVLWPPQSWKSSNLKCKTINSGCPGVVWKFYFAFSTMLEKVCYKGISPKSRQEVLTNLNTVKKYWICMPEIYVSTEWYLQQLLPRLIIWKSINICGYIFNMANFDW